MLCIIAALLNIFRIYDNLVTYQIDVQTKILINLKELITSVRYKQDKNK